MVTVKRAAVLVMAFGMALTGCASTDDDADGPLVTVEVHNNFAGAATQEISIVGEGSSPIPLGTVAAGDTETFSARGLDLADEHRLIADAAGGALIRSAPVVLETGSRVVWDLSTNRVHVVE